MAFVKLDTAGDRVEGPADLMGIVFTGGGTNDTCIIKEIDGEEIWQGNTTTSNTYISFRFPDFGMRIRKGVEVQQIDGGKVFLYFREN
jgi:hypothetical protein